MELLEQVEEKDQTEEESLRPNHATGHMGAGPYFTLQIHGIVNCGL